MPNGFILGHNFPYIIINIVIYIYCFFHVFFIKIEVLWFLVSVFHYSIFVFLFFYFNKKICLNVTSREISWLDKRFGNFRVLQNIKTCVFRWSFVARDGHRFSDGISEIFLEFENGLCLPLIKRDSENLLKFSERLATKLQCPLKIFNM